MSSSDRVAPSELLEKTCETLLKLFETFFWEENFFNLLGV